MSEGENLIDDFELLSCVSAGANSAVYDVCEQRSGRRLAMKLLNPLSKELAEAKASLKHEANVSKTLDNPNIIHFEGFVSHRDATYLLMEYFRAPNVKQQLKMDTNVVHVRIRKLFEAVCQALAHVHEKGWIHRDVKPDNILMNKAGEVRLLDFSLAIKKRDGFAKLIGPRKMSQIQGTRTYIAPETIRKRPPTIQTDLYSLGITFFEILCGKTPFQGSTPQDVLQKHLSAPPPNPSEFNPNVTPEMDRLIVRLLAKKPDQRPVDANDVLTELRRIKIFKVDVEEKVAGGSTAENADLVQELITARLDSRADAQLAELLRTNPEFMERYSAERKTRTKKPDSAKPKIAQPAAPVSVAPAPAMQQGFQPMMASPQGMPGYPGMPLPQGWPMPPQGSPPGGFPPPGMPGYPPQFPYPGQQPQAAYPANPMLGQPPGPAAAYGQPPHLSGPGQPLQPPVPGYPANPPSVPTPVSQGQRPLNAGRQPTNPPNTPEAEDLPLMTELPDVL